mmetsp:Transcript_13386/g.22793  ORF Transcript_13386/g.22793 Transcript_13386/m.22793 type:complete len:91 (+) Transcript_13386:198-470(+)
MSFSEKLLSIKEISDEIIGNTEKNYKRISDLLAFTEDPKDVDIVLKAVMELHRVFLEIIPSYKIRDGFSKDVVDDEEGAKKGLKLSKDVR